MYSYFFTSLSLSLSLSCMGLLLFPVNYANSSSGARVTMSLFSNRVVVLRDIWNLADFFLFVVVWRPLPLGIKE